MDPDATLGVASRCARPCCRNRPESPETGQLSAQVQLRTSEQRVESVVRSLQAGFDDTVDAARITAEVEAEFDTYSEVRVTEFVPIFVERRVRARLTQGQRSGAEHRHDWC